jgi:hypothetical protein
MSISARSLVFVRFPRSMEQTIRSSSVVCPAFRNGNSHLTYPSGPSSQQLDSNTVLFPFLSQFPELERRPLTWARQIFGVSSWIIFITRAGEFCARLPTISQRLRFFANFGSNRYAPAHGHSFLSADQRRYPKSLHIPASFACFCKILKETLSVHSSVVLLSVINYDVQLSDRESRFRGCDNNASFMQGKARFFVEKISNCGANSA